jgi:hypothetical protein
MQLSFHSADRSVTGSCDLVECAGKRILIDCGLQVPIAALFRRGDAWHAFDVKRNRPRFTRVEVARRSGGLAAISKGVRPGDLSLDCAHGWRCGAHALRRQDISRCFSRQTAGRLEGEAWPRRNQPGNTSLR